MKISILLPYKENFSKKYAGAVSLSVKDTTKNSKFFNDISIFGNTLYKNKLLKNYINLDLTKKFYQSTSRKYVESFISDTRNKKADIIEIHNRPNYIRFIKEKLSTKIILYFHNDPLTMSGSKSIKDRKYLLANVVKIIFNSEWSKKRFYVGLDVSLIQANQIYVVPQSASKVKINLKHKKKIITFIGKLNSAKGYDLFGNAIVPILDKYPDWKSTVIGDEPREKLIFKHKNLKIMGFKDHSYVLNYLKKVSISVVCSRWNEPFGRTSLEASSRGCSVIISNRGGLPETTKHAEILNKLNAKEVFNKIEKLIINQKKRLLLQKKNLDNFKFTHQYVSSLIDNIRKDLTPPKFNFSINGHNKNSNKIKILHITNFNERHNGRLHYNTGRRLNNGFIRLGHNVLSISDRDILNKSKSLTDINGNTALNQKIISTAKNFNPDAVIMGHADGVKRNTLEYLKKINPNIKFAQWFLDPISKYGPDYNKNRNRILDKSDLLDASFLTTDPKSLSFTIANSYFMPNPCDVSFETLENYKFVGSNDLFFAMSHGVHRGELKKGKFDDREFFLNRLIKMNKNIKFDVYGMNNVQPIWGSNFVERISNSNMGLNLSRGKPIKYYSSDRVAQLLGNGLLTFIDERTVFNDFFKKDEIILYSSISDLSEKINKYKRDDKLRKKIARNGKYKYFKYFNSTDVSNFILTKTFDVKTMKKFIWDS